MKITQEKLLALLSTKQRVWVEYSRYLTFLECHFFENSTSIVSQYAKQISAVESQPLEFLISRQSGETWSQVGELISNSIDASNPGAGSIGRFGIGFKQVLQELQSIQDDVIVLTKFAANDYARVIHFKKQADGNIYFTDICLLAQEFASLLSVAEGQEPLPSMTQVIVNRRLDSDAQKQIKSYVCRKYERCLYAELLLNEETVNDFSGVYDCYNKAILSSDETPSVEVVVNALGYCVVDYGPGMSDQTIYRHFLNVRVSTKMAQSGGEAFFYAPRMPGDQSDSEIKLLLAGVVIETLKIADMSLPKEVVFCFPQDTTISSSRQHINFDRPALLGLENITNSIFRSNTSSVLKISLINSLINVLKQVTEAGRATSEQAVDSIHRLKRVMRKGIEGILEPQKTYLPRISGIEYLDIGNADPIYLDPAIFPDCLIEKFPFCKKITCFRSGAVINQAFSAPFKAIHGCHTPPTYLIVGSVVIIDQLLYETHCQTASGRAALSHMLNVWIGSAFDDLIPKDNGYFSETDNEFVVLDSDETDVNDADYFQGLAQTFAPKVSIIDKEPIADDNVSVIDVIQPVVLQERVDAPEQSIVLVSQPVQNIEPNAIVSVSLSFPSNLVFFPGSEVEAERSANRQILFYLKKAQEHRLLSQELIDLLVRSVQQFATRGERGLLLLAEIFKVLMKEMPKILDADTLCFFTKNSVIVSLGLFNSLNVYNHIGRFSHFLSAPCSTISNETITEDQIKQLVDFFITQPRLASFVSSASSTSSASTTYLSYEYNIPQLVVSLIKYGDFGLKDHFCHPLVLSALYVFGASIDVLKLGTFLSVELLNKLTNSTTQTHPCQFWIDFWVVAMEAGLDLYTTPEAFQTMMLRIFSIYSNDQLRESLLGIEGKFFSDLIPRQCPIVFDDFKKDRSAWMFTVTKTLGYMTDLTERQLKFLESVVPSLPGNTSKLRDYVKTIIAYGNFGLEDKSFNTKTLHYFLYSVSSSTYFDSLYKTGFLTADWFSHFHQFDDKSLSWWNENYGSSFAQMVYSIPAKESFNFVTDNYRCIVAKGISVRRNCEVDIDSDINFSSVHKNHKDKSNKLNQLGPSGLQCICNFLSEHTLSSDQKKAYLYYFLYYGNLGLKSHLNTGFLWGIALVGKTLARWNEQGLFSQEFISRIADKPEAGAKLFWLMLDKIAADASPSDFNILSQRVSSLCFDSGLSDMQLNGLASFNPTFDFKTINFQSKGPESIKRKMSFWLQDGVVQLPNALSHIAEYYLAFGDTLPPAFAEQRVVKIAIATLGVCFGWYAAHGYIHAEPSILNGVAAEKFNEKDAYWFHRYWTFFGLIQPYLKPKFQGTIIYRQILERWLLICELGKELPDVLLGYLKAPHWLDKFINNEATDDSIFNQYIRFFHEEKVAPIENRPGACHWNHEAVVESLNDVTVAELIVYRGAKNTPEEISLGLIKQGLEEKLEGDRRLDMQHLVSERKQVIKSVILSQPGTDIWLRELIQNCHDALTKAKLEMRIDIEQYCYRNTKTNQWDFVVGIIDRAGMDLYVIVNRLLIPGSSDPEKIALELLGQFGIGFFTTFTAADRLEIKTSIGGPVYLLAIAVERHDQGDINLNIEYIHETKNEEHYRGTEIRRIKSYSDADFLKAQLEGFCLTSQINYFAGGLLAPVNTLSFGQEKALPVPDNKKVMIYYNTTPIKEPQREFLAEVPVHGVGPLKIYRQENLSTNRVEQSGLFVGVLGHSWTSLVPTVFQEELGHGLVIELPARAKLNSDRSGLCQEDTELFQKTFFVLYMQALLYLCFQKNHYIKMMPRDFYRQIGLNYSTISREISELRHAINLRLNPSETEWYGDWATDFPGAAIERYRDNRFLAVQLLTLIEEKQQITLSDVLNKVDGKTDVGPMFRRDLDIAKAVRTLEKQAPSRKILKPDDWTRDQKILAFVIQSLHQKTGMGFREVVYFEQPESGGVVAYVQRSTGLLIGDADDIVYPIHINVSTYLFALRKAWLLERDISHLIYDKDGANLIRTLAHETAHTEEYKKELLNGLNLIEDYRVQYAGSVSDELADKLRREIRRHFISRSSDIYANLEVLAANGDDPFPKNLHRSLRVWVKALTQHDENDCWTHNADEKYKDSFINMMKRVMDHWVRSGIFIQFKAIVDAAFAEYPDEEFEFLPEQGVSAQSPSVVGHGTFFQLAAPQAPLQDDLSAAGDTVKQLIVLL